MIQLLDRALEEFLRARVPLSTHAVDISFQAPDKTWGAALSRPTVNVFLWDVASHSGYLKTGMQQRVNPAGSIERRPLNPVVDLGYLVTAWATERRDEHELLGSVLRCVLAHHVLPDEFVPDQFNGARCGLSLAPADRRMPGDFWSALEGRLRPGLQAQLAVPDRGVRMAAHGHAGRGGRRDRRAAGAARRGLCSPAGCEDAGRRQGERGREAAPRRRNRRRQLTTARHSSERPAGAGTGPWSWRPERPESRTPRRGPDPMRASLSDHHIALEPGRWASVSVEITNTAEVIDGISATVQPGVVPGPPAVDAGQTVVPPGPPCRRCRSDRGPARPPRFRARPRRRSARPAALRARPRRRSARPARRPRPQRRLRHPAARSAPGAPAAYPGLTFAAARSSCLSSPTGRASSACSSWRRTPSRPEPTS